MLIGMIQWKGNNCWRKVLEGKGFHKYMWTLAVDRNLENSSVVAGGRRQKTGMWSSQGCSSSEGDGGKFLFHSS